MNALVRLFIVQERFNEGEWLDDPDQPDDYAHGFDQAKWWMENDNKTCRGHETTYEHRIIERTETQVWPNRKAERRRERGVRINPKRNPGVLSSVGLADIMKIERHDIEETTIEAFADKNGLVMEVRERKKPVGDPSRYYAHFKSAQVREGTHGLIGLFANGRTPEEAIAEYASDISLRTLIIDARTKEQREIEVPRLSANKVLSNDTH